LLHFCVRAQILPDAPVCELVSLNLVTVAEPTFHIARFLPSVRDSKAPLLFVWHVRTPARTCAPSPSPLIKGKQWSAVSMHACMSLAVSLRRKGRNIKLASV
jgi:hypothetical protein